MYRRLKPLPHPECQRQRCAVPPSPGLMQDLLQRWTDLMAEKRLPPDTTFKQWFDYWVSARRREHQDSFRTHVFWSGKSIYYDTGDLYPHGNKRTIGKSTKPAINLPGGKWSGVTLRIKGRAGDDVMKLDVIMA